MIISHFTLLDANSSWTSQLWDHKIEADLSFTLLLIHLEGQSFFSLCLMAHTYLNKRLINRELAWSFLQENWDALSMGGTFGTSRYELNDTQTTINGFANGRPI